MTLQVPENSTNTYLTLSAAPDDGLRSDRSAAVRLEDLLELRDRATARGLTALADEYTDRIIDEMTAGAVR